MNLPKVEIWKQISCAKEDAKKAGPHHSGTAKDKLYNFVQATMQRILAGSKYMLLIGATPVIRKFRLGFNPQCAQYFPSFVLCV